MTKGTIAFDVDGVVANFIRGFTRIGNRFFGTPISDTPAHTCWMFEEFPSLGLDKAKCTAIWADIKASPFFWANLDPCNVSIMHTIDRIANKIFITNRPGKLPLEQTAAFLERWGVIDPKVIVAADKGPVAKAEHVIATVDDYYPNCRDIKEACPDAYVAMLATPYNECHRVAPRSPSADPWMGDVVLSVDHFIIECDKRGLIEWREAVRPLGMLETPRKQLVIQ